MKLRLDANGSMGFSDIIKFVTKVNTSSIEYFEDPLSDIENMIKLSEELNIPIALDESITADNIEKLLEISTITHYVIKPIKLGFDRTKKIVEIAQQKGKSIMISSVFESAVGRSGLVYLASLTQGNHAHGLDTKRYLGRDIDDSVYPCNESSVKFNIVDYPPKFDLERVFL